MFGLTIEYEGSYSRWQYMFKLIDYGIQSGQIVNILAYPFDESNSVRNISELDKREFEKFHKKSVKSALEKINAILYFEGNKMIIDSSKKVLIILINLSTSRISIKNVKTIDRD